MNLDGLKTLFEDFDPAALLPELDTMLGKLELLMRIAVLIGPVIVLVLGLVYLLAPPKEANHYFGYRCWFGMGSVQAWQFTQRLAGTAWLIMGLVLAVIAAANVGELMELELMDAMFLAGKYIIRQALTVFISVICINIVVFARYDRKGIRRASWRELLGRDE